MPAMSEPQRTAPATAALPVKISPIIPIYSSPINPAHTFTARTLRASEAPCERSSAVDAA